MSRLRRWGAPPHPLSSDTHRRTQSAPQTLSGWWSWVYARTWAACLFQMQGSTMAGTALAMAHTTMALAVSERGLLPLTSKFLPTNSCRAYCALAAACAFSASHPRPATYLCHICTPIRPTVETNCYWVSRVFKKTSCVLGKGNNFFYDQNNKYGRTETDPLGARPERSSSPPHTSQPECYCRSYLPSPYAFTTLAATLFMPANSQPTHFPHNPPASPQLDLHSFALHKGVASPRRIRATAWELIIGEGIGTGKCGSSTHQSSPLLCCTAPNLELQPLMRRSGTGMAQAQANGSFQGGLGGLQFRP